MSFLRRPFSRRTHGANRDDGSGQGSDVTMEEASGAPVETSSPLGDGVGPITIVFLNIGMMIGTGVYSTRERHPPSSAVCVADAVWREASSILKGTGSVGQSMIYWALGFLASIASFSVYLEFASYFPNRSGSEVVYLEQAWPRPKWLFPTAFAFQSVALSFSSGNAIVLSQYLFRVAGADPSPWQLKGVAVAGFTVATLDPFEGRATAYGLTNALYRIIFSYSGYENAFNVVNEVKDPVRQIRKNGWIALSIVTVLYLMANIAYFAAVPKADLAAAEQIAASLFFKNVFGSSRAVRGLNFLIALSSFGNLLTVLIGSSRMLRECGRQGVLPYPRSWASTRPFGTTLGPYLVKWLLTVIMVIAPPAGDAFNFIRWRRKRLNLPRPTFKAWDIIIIFNIAKDVYLLVMPWYLPDGGPFAGDVSFWYATYVVAGIGILVGCGVYYWLWIYAVPKLKGYEIRQQVLELADGAQSHKLVKVPVAELAEWDAIHDQVGRPLQQAPNEQATEEENKGPYV
ncbi:putative high-affinity methionine permease [Colletotrichum sublineola]|uniref:Putative high-affinity methionine permease n=1 Tax=Colletotrichum sublineola TaxID=1173701 RepID=A0A066X1H7_COLSU|nr:putative high-affinity methionine permease [Colletotrichum sublineola]